MFLPLFATACFPVPERHARPTRMAPRRYPDGWRVVSDGREPYRHPAPPAHLVGAEGVSHLYARSSTRQEFRRDLFAVAFSHALTAPVYAAGAENRGREKRRWARKWARNVVAGARR